MNEDLIPKYPIYIPSKGRWDNCLTADILKRDQTSFKLVVEEQEANQYAEIYGSDNLLILPFSNMGSVVPARNWIKDHAKKNGHEYHWQIDDDMTGFYREIKGKRISCASNAALSICEIFVDRYSNIAAANLCSAAFPRPQVPFQVNRMVYCCQLVKSDLPYQWRTKNEDADFSLQVLSAGFCTVNFNAFVFSSAPIAKGSGGNANEIYQNDGQMKMAREFERLWPSGTVKTTRRFGKVQQNMGHIWKKFDTRLELKKGINLDDLPKVNEHGMKIIKQDKIKSDNIKGIYERFKNSS